MFVEVPMKTRKWLLPLLLSLPLAAVVLCLGACLPVGVGDPEASKVDPRLTGTWVAIDKDGTEGNLFVLLPFDSRTYVMRAIAVDRAGEEVKIEPGEGIYKVWLTTIGERTFVTAQPLYQSEAVEDAKRPGFLVAAIQLSDDGTKLEARGVNPSFEALAPLKALPGHADYEPPAEGTKAPSEKEAKALLEKVIAANVGNDKLYAEDVLHFRRITDKALLKRLFERFE